MGTGIMKTGKSQMMNQKEVKLPFVMEDFETGDRVYREVPTEFSVLFGTVTGKEGQYVDIEMDNGMEFSINIRDFTPSDDRGFFWGKSLPIAQMVVGSIVSKYYDASIAHHYPTEKFYAEITEITESSISYRHLQEPFIDTTMIHPNGESFEEEFRKWTLEE